MCYATKDTAREELDRLNSRITWLRSVLKDSRPLVATEGTWRAWQRELANAEAELAELVEGCIRE